MVDLASTEEALRLAETRLDCRAITWTGLVNGQNGTPVEWPFGADKSVQVTGTPGAAGHIQIQGSNDRTNWFVLTDPLGNSLDFTSSGLKEITEMVLQIRPAVTAGDNTTTWVVSLLMRRARTY